MFCRGLPFDPIFFLISLGMYDQYHEYDTYNQCKFIQFLLRSWYVTTRQFHRFTFQSTCNRSVRWMALFRQLSKPMTS